MDRLVAIGDIHGCLHTLKDLLRMVSYSSQTDTLVFVGDYIDRGRFSCEVVNMLMKLLIVDFVIFPKMTAVLLIE